MLIQKLRLKHGWSQQQLAEAAGISVRTIQRIEAGKPATSETLKCIAAVLDVDFTTLNTEHNMKEELDTAREEQEAFKYVRRLRGFYIHLFRYVAICLFLLVVNLLKTPEKLWALWVIGGWGLGVLSHGWSVIRPARILGPEWEREQVEKRLGRSL